MYNLVQCRPFTMPQRPIQNEGNGGGPVPHQRLDHSWPTSCCLPAKCDGRSGSHPEKGGQTCSGHVRVSGCGSIDITLYQVDFIIDFEFMVSKLLLLWIYMVLSHMLSTHVHHLNVVNTLYVSICGVIYL